MFEKKIILFGGTFDPVHKGHTAVAKAAAECIGAEKVIFIPTKHSPLKDFLPKASDADRMKMIALAISENENFQISDYELKKPERSYTLQTVRHFTNQYAGVSIYWLVGADSVDDLPLWYGIEELIDECNVSVMFRAGFDKPDFRKFMDLWGSDRIEKLQKNIIETPLIDISSTQIRKILSAGGNADEMLNAKVAQYIHRGRLYHIGG
jgi:nicotinate-nucleotide adenylyltransferase